MKPAFVRRHPDASAEAGLAWLIALHSASAAMAGPDDNWFARLAESPLDCFERTVRPTPDEARLLHQTKSLISPLRYSPMPLVFEHGDLSSPNVLITDDGEVEVVDWELAEPRGMVATDLFFFLTYIAFARRNATRVDEQISAFREAFFGSAAWARPYVARYAERLGMSSQLMKPLFVLCWCRYVARLLVRIAGEGSGLETEQAAAWLRENRYFALWREAVERYDEVSLT
jgi:aminoglycoside phosphotransferase (APT) family kinase protein